MRLCGLTPCVFEVHLKIELERKGHDRKHQLISLKQFDIGRRGDKERMKQCWISGSNFLTNLCWEERRVWPPTSGRRLGPGWRRWQRQTGNLPKETTRSQWASSAQAFILWERGRHLNSGEGLGRLLELLRFGSFQVPYFHDLGPFTSCRLDPLCDCS